MCQVTNNKLSRDIRTRRFTWFLCATSYLVTMVWLYLRLQDEEGAALFLDKGVHASLDTFAVSLAIEIKILKKSAHF